MLSALKIEETIARTEKALEGYAAPAALVSFGKDSLVLWHLFRHLRLPVVMCVPPLMRPQLWAHIDTVIARWALKMHELKPAAVHLVAGGGELALLTDYELRPGARVQWRQRVPAGGRVCSLPLLRSFVPSPIRTHVAELDVVLCGQKNGDPDFQGGTYAGLADRVTQSPNGVDVLLPLKDWSDADVWDYIERFNLPVDPARYDLKARCERPETKVSNDRAEICAACVDPRVGPARVPCPARGGAPIPREIFP